MTTNLSTLGFAERKQIIRLLVEEVVVNTVTEEITVRHILPVEQMFPLCKRSIFSTSGAYLMTTGRGWNDPPQRHARPLSPRAADRRLGTRHTTALPTR